MDLSVSELIGKTLVSIENDGDLIFRCDTGEAYMMFHPQDCCETVYLEDICGDLEDLIGVPILKAEEVSNQEFENGYESKFKTSENGRYEIDDQGNYKPDSYSWTFYKFATIKGYVDLRWFGTSNGYYSESVSFVKADENGDFPRW